MKIKVKNKSVIRRKIGNVENAYFAEVVFNYGSPIKYPYAKGYYMALTPCKIMLDENGKENIEKDTKYTQEELLFEINEPSENAINIALDVADIYVETLMMQIEQQKIDEKRKENDMKYRLENAKLDLEYGLDETKEGFNMKWNKRDGNNNNNVNTDDANNTDNSRIGIEKSKYYTKPSEVTFDDIAGMIEVKREVMEAISLFRDREKYEKMGVTSKMNNILLSGAPGAGKTLMVKAMSNELGIPLFQSSGKFA